MTMTVHCSQMTGRLSSLVGFSVRSIWEVFLDADKCRWVGLGGGGSCCGSWCRGVVRVLKLAGEWVDGWSVVSSPVHRSFGAGLVCWWLGVVCWLVGWPGGGSWLVVFLLSRVSVGLAVACRWSGDRMTVGVGHRGFSLGLLGLLGTMVDLDAVVVVWFGFPQTMERFHGHRLVRHAIHVVCPDWRGCGCAGSAVRSWVDHGSSVCSQKSPWRVRVSPPRRDHRTRALRYVVDSLRWLGWCLGRPGCSSRRCFSFFSVVIL